MLSAELWQMLLPVSDINPENCGSCREAERARVPGSRGGVNHAAEQQGLIHPQAQGAFLVLFGLVGWLGTHRDVVPGGVTWGDGCPGAAGLKGYGRYPNLGSGVLRTAWVLE